MIPPTGLGYGGGCKKGPFETKTKKGEECNMTTYVLVHGAWHTGA
jgi:hypothetical protein